MVIPQHLAASAQGIFVDFSCFPRTTQTSQVFREITSRHKGMRMVEPEYLPEPRESILVEC